MSLDDLDRESYGPFTLKIRGERVVLRSPETMTWRETAACIADVAAFIRLTGLPGVPLESALDVQRQWVVRHGLTEDDTQTRRLAHAMDRYSRQLEADFPRHYPGVGPADLWRARKWRCLLNLIDHLPQNTHYQHALANDPEHAKRVAEYKANHPDEKTSKAPPWHVWSPELAKLTDAVEQLKRIAYLIPATQGGKPEKPRPEERPTSEIDKAIYRKRWEGHKKLADKLLGRT